MTVAPAPFVLLPPSEGKAPGGTRAGCAGTFDAALRGPRRAVRAALADALAGPPAARPKLFGATGALLDRAVAATTSLVEGRPPRLPAWQRYTGVVWTELEPDSLEAADRRHILVPSAVYGVTTAEDRIADHRIKLSVRLGDLGVLARFWQPTVTAALARHCADSTVVDLLPVEHAAAVDWATLAAAATVVRVRFVTSTGRAVGHDAKAAKGAFARTVLTRGLDGATSFSWRGWTARRDRSASSITVTAP